MKLLRWVAAGLLWIVGGLVGLVGVLLTATLLLAPIGIPLLMLARRLFGAAGRLVVPRAVRHPLDQLDRSGSGAAADLKSAVRKSSRRARKKAVKEAGQLGGRIRSARKQMPKPAKKRKGLRARLPGS